LRFSDIAVAMVRAYRGASRRRSGVALAARNLQEARNVMHTIHRLIKRRASPAMGVALVALALALGAGAAYAKGHFIITSTSQIKPAVLAKLRSARGTNGSNGANGTNGSVGAKGPAGATGATGTAGSNGANGTNGTNGSNGSAGPGAIAFETTVVSPTYPDEVTSALPGPIPVELGCQNNDASSPIVHLESIAHDSASGSGRADASWNSDPTNAGTYSNVPWETLNQSFPTAGSSVLLNAYPAPSTDVTTGTLFLTYLPTGATLVTETVSFELTTAGNYTNSECGITAQIVASS
jgi:Collagen triple helix repeat (20 copies)